MNNTNQSILSFIIKIILGTIAVFVLTAFLTIPANSKFFEYPALENLTEFESVTDSMLLLMSYEMPLLEQQLENRDIEKPSYSNLFFDVFSGISPNDYTSLIDHELPGLDIYYNLQTGGEEAMPIESPPPDFDKLLKEDKEDEPEDPSEDPNAEMADVFIYQSHGWEAYFPLMEEKDATKSDSTKIEENVVGVGVMLKEALEKKGIYAVHDKTNSIKVLAENGWGYNESYQLSGKILDQAVTINSGLNYYIDIHRDGTPKEVTTATIEGKKYAKLFFVVGKEHENYEMNYERAKQLNKALEEKYPGISRGVFLKDYSDGNGVYNQNISSNSFLIEFGGEENNKEELENTVNAFAEVFAEFHQTGKEVNAD
ncbi:stage II sporulation protein P [Bacillaceae bacterium S4-13-58]